MSELKSHNFNDFVNRVGSDSWKWDKEFPGIKYPMGCADMDFKSPQEVVDAIQQYAQKGAFGYTGYDCVAAMAESITGYYQRRHNYTIHAGDIIYTSGLMVAFNMLLEAFSAPGDKVILQTPVYHSFRVVIERAGLSVSENPLTLDRDTMSYAIDFDGLKKCAADPRTRIMMLCNPMNPVGKKLTAEELNKIYEICRDNNVLLISDEVHGDLYYGENKHIPLHAVSEEIKNNTIMISASGKTFNIAAFYASYVVIPSKSMRDIYNVKMQRNHADINELAVIANTVAYKECDYYIDGLVNQLENNLNIIRNFLAKEQVGVKLVEPEATYLAWLDFSNWGLSSDNTHKLLLDHGVGLANGAKFGPVGEGFMRMNFACHQDTLIGALEAIKQAYSVISH